MASYRGRRNGVEIGPGVQPILMGPAAQAVETMLQARRAEEGDRPTAAGTRLRGSFAGDCPRKIAFQILGVAPDLVFDGSTLAAFDVGQSWHDVIQAALVAQFDAETEVVCELDGHDLSGHADAMYVRDGRRVVVEIKSMKKYAWELACEGNHWDGTGPGPKREHLLQAGLYAEALGASLIHYIYVCKDDARIAEFLIDTALPLPHMGGLSVFDMVGAELRRLAGVLADVDAGLLPAREVPEWGLVMYPPASGSKDKPWNCRFCGWQPSCSAQPAGAVPVPVELRGAAA